VLFIFGAGGGSFELLESINDLVCSDYINDEKIILVEDDPKDEFKVVRYKGLGSKISVNYQVINHSDMNKFTGGKTHYGFISVNDAKYKEKIEKEFKLRYVTFIHKGSDILADDVGCGNWFGYGTHVGSDVKLGNHIRMNYGAKVTHCCEIGDYSFIGINSVLCGGVKIGKGVQVNSGAVIINKNITIGDYAIIGAGAVVTKDVKPGQVVMGVPAKEKVKKK
jgi:acetyltransferase EpsM